MTIRGGSAASQPAVTIRSSEAIQVRMENTLFERDWREAARGLPMGIRRLARAPSPVPTSADDTRSPRPCPAEPADSDAENILPSHSEHPAFTTVSHQPDTRAR